MGGKQENAPRLSFPGLLGDYVPLLHIIDRPGCNNHSLPAGRASGSARTRSAWLSGSAAASWNMSESCQECVRLSTDNHRLLAAQFSHVIIQGIAGHLVDHPLDHRAGGDAGSGAASPLAAARRQWYGGTSSMERMRSASRPAHLLRRGRITACALQRPAVRPLLRPD